MKKLICKIFGHNWQEGSAYMKKGGHENARLCLRCGIFEYLCKVCGQFNCKPVSNK